MGSLSHQDFTERLRTLLSAPQAVTDLKRYFAVDLPYCSPPPYTGARFEQLDGGGDRPGTANTITASDLIAVQLLSVTIPGRAALALLEGTLDKELTALLGKIPIDVDMTEVDNKFLNDNSPATKAWQQLVNQSGLGWVTSSKLLARKRPRLLPVYDKVVRCAIGHPISFWLSLHHALTSNNKKLHDHLLHLRDASRVPNTVSALRICDVVLWMGHSDGHQAKGCRGPFA